MVEICMYLAEKSTSPIRNSKIRYFRAIFNEKKQPEEYWKILRSVGLGRKRDEKPLSVPLESLNEFFCKKEDGFDSTAAIDEYSDVSTDRDPFLIGEVSEEIVKKNLMAVKSSSIGADGIPVTVLHTLSDVIVPILTHIFNYSLTTGCYPDVWKKAIIKPLGKVKEPTLASEFRGISILCAMGKVLDKIVYNEFTSWLEGSSVLDPKQSAYRSGYSTETALISVLDEVRRAMDEKKVTFLVMIDFSAAFDMLRRDVLVALLKSLGIGDSMMAWFYSYLQDRRQCVKGMDNELSTWKDTLIGTPQGSVLSAKFFTLYVGSLPKTLSTGCCYEMYADDLQLYRSCKIDEIPDTVVKLNEDLQNLHKWTKTHGMKINSKKTKVMLLGYTKLLRHVDFPSVPQIKIDGETLGLVSEAKNLGVIIRNDLSWELHVTNTCKTIFKILYQLRRIAIDFPKHVRKQLVEALIFPHFDYASTAFCDLRGEEVGRLQKAQNAAVRFVLRLRMDEHVTPAYVKLGWLKIKERKKLAVASLMFKIIKFRQPEYLYERITWMADVHDKGTRNAKKLMQIPVQRTNIYERSFLVQSVKIFNENGDLFDLKLKADTFKKNYKEVLIQTYM